jgi:hypothetical protein
MSRLITNAIRSTSASADAITFDNSGKPAFPNGGAGRILQVKNVTKTDTFSENLASGTISSTNVLELSFTAASTSNRLLIIVDMNMSHQDTNETLGIVLHADGSVITAATGDASGSRTRVTSAGAIGYPNNGFVNVGMNYYHTPTSTSAVNYQIRQYNGDSQQRYVYINASQVDGDSAVYHRPISSMTIMEVAA